MAIAPAEVGNPRFEPQTAGESHLRHVETAAHPGMPDFFFPKIGHTPGARRLVLDDPGRALVDRAVEFPAPYRNAIDHAARQAFEPPRFPRLLTRRQIERRLAVEPIEPGADDCRLLHPDAVVADQIGHAA